MKKIISGLLLSLVWFGYSSSFEIEDEKNKEKFYALIENGYQEKMRGYEVIPFFVKNTKTCIYNTSPNSIAKEVIDTFYKLLKKEFHFGSHVYVKDIDDCPSDTRIYFMLRDKLNPYKSLGAEYIRVFKRHGIENKLTSRANTMAFGGIKLSKGVTIGFLTVNQMTESISNKIVAANLRRLLLQELFQTITIGKDITVYEKSMSILHENGKYPGYVEEINTDLFSKSMSHEPIGLCGYDLWYLLVWNKFDKPLEFKTKFIKEFENNYLSIKKEALKIENNPAYKVLFDPRCSGKNTGINTKIGIE